MANFNSENFKVGPCVVAYKGQLLGATRDGVKIVIDSEVVDIACDQSYGQPVKRVVTNVKLSVTMTMLEIDPNLSLLLDDNKITAAALGTDLMKKGGELLLTSVDSNDPTGYRFPNAVLEPNSEYSLPGSAPHSVRLRFTAHRGDTGSFFEKVTL